ncbi:hypothetical protein WJX82_000524 [Trebouxia sp. C0006]
MEPQQNARKSLARRLFRKASGIAGLLRKPSKRHSEASLEGRIQSKNSDPYSVDPVASIDRQNSSQHSGHIEGICCSGASVVDGTAQQGEAHLPVQLLPGTDAKMVHAALSTSNSSVDQAIMVLERKGLTHVPSAFCLKDVFQGVQKMDGSQWVVVWDTCALMKDSWVGYQLLEEVSVYQVIPFMTHLELNHIKDDKSDPEKAHKGQEGVKLVNTGLQPEYKGRFKLQPEYGEPPNAKDFLPPLTADRDSHIGDDFILQCAAFWDNRAQQLTKQMVFLTNDIALTNRALALGIQTSQAPHWLKHSFS